MKLIIKFNVSFIFLFFRCLEKVFEEERNMNKTWGTLVGVSHWCTYWCTHILSYLDKFLKHFNVISIYSVVKVMKSGWSFAKKLDRVKASFSRYWHLKFNPEKPNSYITISASKFQEPCCSPYKVKTFPHSYALLRSLVFAKNLFYVKQTTFFKSENIKFDTKTTTNSESSS